MSQATEGWARLFENIIARNTPTQPSGRGFDPYAPMPPFGAGGEFDTYTGAPTTGSYDYLDTAQQPTTQFEQMLRRLASPPNRAAPDPMTGYGTTVPDTSTPPMRGGGGYFNPTPDNAFKRGLDKIGELVRNGLKSGPETGLNPAMPQPQRSLWGDPFAGMPGDIPGLPANAPAAAPALAVPTGAPAPLPAAGGAPAPTGQMVPGSYTSIPADAPSAGLPVPQIPTPPIAPPASPATPPPVSATSKNPWKDPRAWENLMHFGLALMAASDASQGNGVQGPSLAGAIGKAGLATQGRVDKQRTDDAAKAFAGKKFETETAIKRRELELKTYQIAQDAGTKRLLLEIQQDNKRLDRVLQAQAKDTQTVLAVSRLQKDAAEQRDKIALDPSFRTEEERQAAIRANRQQESALVDALLSQAGIAGSAPSAKAASDVTKPVGRVTLPDGRVVDDYGNGRYKLITQ